MQLAKKLGCFIFFYLLIICCDAQDSSHIRISLLTCSPGDELYSTFGHSALRVTDSIGSSDVVFNYGTFNFDDPDFYTKFIRGKLLYYVSAEIFEDFKEDYQTDNRSITEQVLNFSPEEKIEIEDALYNNLKEENKYYKYDFFFDNCTTRLRDIIANHKNPRPIFNAVMPTGTTFRQAIYIYLDKNKKYWSKLSIDILLGAKTDAVMTTEQSQFLPDNLMKTLDASNANHQLVLSEKKLYDVSNESDQPAGFTPMLFFWSLFLFIALLGFSKNKYALGFLQGFDGLIFFLTGVLGIVLIFMWTCTDHVLCANNYNLLWAWPTNAVMAFFILSKKNWVKKYFKVVAIGLSVVLLAWFFLPQLMNNSLIPLVLLLIWRSVHKSFPKNNSSTL